MTHHFETLWHCEWWSGCLLTAKISLLQPHLVSSSYTLHVGAYGKAPTSLHPHHCSLTNPHPPPK